MFQVIDTLAGNVVVATYPTLIKAKRAARSVEEVPEGRPLGFRAIDGSTRDWRYQLRRSRPAARN